MMVGYGGHELVNSCELRIYETELLHGWLERCCIGILDNKRIMIVSRGE
jgi:hypothetical protein